MSEFTCDRCGYSPKTKGNFKKHCYSKKLCEPILSDISQEEMQEKYFSVANKFKCDATACNIYLSSKKIKGEHHNRCKHMTKQRLVESASPSVSNIGTINNTNNTNNTNTNNTNSHNTTNNTNNVTNNITINTFGDENTDHLDNPYIRKCLNRRKSGVLDYITQRYFDPAHPENMTINKQTKRDPLVLCSTENGEGEIKLVSEVTEAIIAGYGFEIREFLNYVTRNGKPFKSASTLKHFITDVGGPLDMDLSPHDVQCGYNESIYEPKQIEKKKNDIHKLIDAQLYEKSNEIFRTNTRLQMTRPTCMTVA